MISPSGLRPVLPLPVRLQADVVPRGAGITIAMVDSDFVTHPDLMQPTVRIAAYFDAVQQRVHPLPPATTVVPRHWHGTMTACTAAGNGYLSQGEFASLAPEASVVLVRTMNDEGRITTPTIVHALEWIGRHAATYDIRVVNLSVYADEVDQSLDHPVTRAVEALVGAGIVVVAAAGNNPMAPIRPPASAPHALTVGGLDDGNSLDREVADLYHSSFGVTTLGVQKPDVIAPAIWLPAPMLPGTATQREAAALCALDAMTDDMLVSCAPRLLPDTGLPVSLWSNREADVLRQRITARIQDLLIASPFYKMVDGTSFAAPIVASIVAQMLDVHPSLRPAEVAALLMSTAVPLAQHPRHRQGAGVVRQREALAAAREARQTPKRSRTSR